MRWCASVWLLIAAVSSWGQAALVSTPRLDSISSNTAPNEEIVSPLRVAQCRAQCLQKFADSRDRTGASCLQGPDCFMCWENCALLQSNYPVWGAMCTEKRICFPGCQQACRFHHETVPQLQSEPVIRTQGEEVITVIPLSQGGGVARWRPAPAPRQKYVVYVLMVHPPGSSSWRLISQSVECETRLEPGNPAMNPDTTVRVLVVDPEGLVTIYSPIPSTPVPTSSTSPAPAESTKAPPDLSSMATPVKDEYPEPWKLREVSLLHQRVLVIAEVAWTPRAKRGVYLVTWEIDGGGLRGNLFTDSTSVTLSLWPDTIYHIQVELVSRGGGHRKPERSELLVIDTRKAPHVQAGPAAETSDPVVDQWQKQQQQQQQHASSSSTAPHGVAGLSREMLAGTGAAILLFLLVGATAAWLCLRQQSTACCSLYFCSSCSHKRRLLLADDSLSAAVIQPSIVSVLTSKDCNPEVAGESWPPAAVNPTIRCGPQV